MTARPNESDRPDVGRHSVPVSSPYGGATGFLGRTQGRIGLYTAAHNLAVTDPLTAVWPVDGWRWLIPTLNIHPALDDEVRTLRVFSATGVAEGDEVRTALFSWLVTRAGLVKDAVRFDLAYDSELLEACAERFDVVNLDDAEHHLAEGERLTCVGLPGWADPAIAWPYFPPACNESQFIHVDHEGNIKAAGHAEKGFSGAPVFVGEGRFAGMLVGSNRGWERGVYYEHVRIISPQDLIEL